MVRACTTKVEPGMKVDTLSKPIKDAQYEAMSRILKIMNFIARYVITTMEIVSFIIPPKIWKLNIKNTNLDRNHTHQIIHIHFIDMSQINVFYVEDAWKLVKILQVNETFRSTGTEKNHVSFGIMMYPLMNLLVYHVDIV